MDPPVGQFSRAPGSRRFRLVRRARRHSILALLGLAGAAAVSLPIIASAGPGGISPDLRADPVGGHRGTAGLLHLGARREPAAGPLRRLRHEHRRGPARGVGQPAARGLLGLPAPLGLGRGARAPSRRSRSSRSPSPTRPATATTTSTSTRAMRYSLWNLRADRSGRAGPEGRLLPLRHRGRARPVAAAGPRALHRRRDQFCDQNQQSRRTCGWARRRGGATSTTSRWPTSGSTSPTPPRGSYLVGAEADPDNTIWEGGGGAESNAPAFASQQVTIPGWTAQPVSLAQTGRRPGRSALAAPEVRHPGQLEPALPGHLGAGQRDAERRRRPGLRRGQPARSTRRRPGYQGADSFTYVARSVSLAASRSAPRTRPCR